MNTEDSKDSFAPDSGGVECSSAHCTSSEEYNSDSSEIITKFTSKKSVIGYHLMPTCSLDPGNSRLKKKMKLCPSIRKDLLNNEFMEKFNSNWNNNVCGTYEDVELIADPFKVCIINEFLENKDILSLIRNEFYEVEWNVRNMDLYEFFQSKDLKYINLEHIKSLYDFLKSDVMQWVGKITGYDLVEVSATCSLYTNSDYLLVHDDQKNDRMVAFVLYLTGANGWSISNGGALQLLNKDTNGQPVKVVKDIYPKHNQMVLFPVSGESYHQVAEVTCLEDVRLTINGWFHTKMPPVFEIPIYEPVPNSLFNEYCLKAQHNSLDLQSWVNADYLNDDTIKTIQQYIEENSEISLKEFFKTDVLKVVEECLLSLQNKDEQWQEVGPPNRYHYNILLLENVPDVLENFLKLFQAKEFFALLEKYTDLELSKTCSSMKFELQKWTPGNYALLTDYDWHKKNELDLIVYFGCTEGSNSIIGAKTQYVTIEEEVQEALITIEPNQNRLNLVYRDSARFTKYFSKQSKCKCFFMLLCSYSE